MLRIDPFIVRDQIENSDIIRYHAEVVSATSLMHWSDDLRKVMQEHQSKTNLRLLYNVTGPRSSLPFLVLSEREFMNPGLTTLGRASLSQFLVHNQHMHIHFALVLSDSVEGQVPKHYITQPKTDLAQVTAQIFFDEDDAIKWLKRSQVATSVLPVTRPITLDRKKMRSKDALATEEKVSTFGERDEVTFLIENRLISVDLTPSKSIIIGRKVPGHHDHIVHLNLSDHQRGLSVSRQHARIDLKGEKLYITDLHSTNGTTVNGQYVNPSVPRLIHNKDSIQIGEIKISVVF